MRVLVQLQSLFYKIKFMQQYAEMPDSTMISETRLYTCGLEYMYTQYPDRHR